jgi:hypothetical protein
MPHRGGFQIEREELTFPILQPLGKLHVNVYWNQITRSMRLKFHAVAYANAEREVAVTLYEIRLEARSPRPIHVNRGLRICLAPSNHRT